MTVTRPALRYFGGKWRLFSWLHSHFPPHQCYVEPYSGSAAVLLRKTPSPFEVYNDLDHEVVNFFRVLRTEPDTLIQAIALTPYSRFELQLSYVHTPDPIEAARRYFVRAWQGWGGPRKIQKTGWKMQHRAWESSRANQIDEWITAGENLYHVAQRLKRVQIECDDALHVIKRWDSPQTLFYCDPPYLPNTISRRWAWNAYSHTVEADHHVHLLNLLRQVKGSVVLSGYPNLLYDELLPNWTQHTTTSQTLRSGRPGGRAVATEVIWVKKPL